METLKAVPSFMLLPFILMLAAIAILPLFAARFWEKNRNKFITALALALPSVCWLLFNGLSAELWKTVVFDYFPFLILLGSLFIISGGIFVDGDIEARPGINTMMLGLSAVAASLMGTTGAAMLFIRPLINTNRERKYKVHTILFFIGIAANCGGLLTPLGDPPLFMMYLRGVSFEWFLRLAPEWLLANSLLLLIYYFVDSHFYKKEPAENIQWDRSNIVKIAIKGKLNIIWLAGVILSVALINPKVMPWIGGNEYFSFAREGVVILMSVLSLLTTGREIRKSNNFNWEPIEEVAYLFFGIFVTMVPCLRYLEQNAPGLGIITPAQFYYSTGALSSFLDNTPTAVTFYAIGKGLVEASAYPGAMPMAAGIPAQLMSAICTGAVFFGSMTYIGNGPNFMVKAIAENEGIEMPHFFAYIYKFSVIVLLPIFILVQLLLISF